LLSFWEQHDYYTENYVEPPPTPAVIASIETELGYRLPASYIALMQSQNGGAPVNVCFPTTTRTSWAEDHVAIQAFMGIGRDKGWSLCGPGGSQFMMDEWGYPAIGVYFGNCPSAGHDMIALDYRQCGPHGEPQVVHVDQERDYQITVLAPDFEAFVRGLVHESRYDDDPEEVKREAKALVLHAPFNGQLQALCAAWADAAMPAIIRRLAGAIVDDKGYFSLHADDKSHLMYDLQFLLLSHRDTFASQAAYLQAYPGIIAMAGVGHFGTGGWAPSFVEAWFKARAEANQLVRGDDEAGWRFSDDYRDGMLRRLQAYG